ncbi:MAG: DNA gyrase inhibitor YacG [Pseudomonadota bacterium]
MTVKSPECPVCREATNAKWRPFCSQRCADIDLGRWVTGSYRIPTHEPVDEDDRNGND